MGGKRSLLCTVLESIIEKWGKKDLAKTTSKKGAPFWNRIPKNEENHGGEKILVQSRENRPGEAHRQQQLATQYHPRARTRIKAV